jgi:hypothetical protein
MMSANHLSIIAKPLRISSGVAKSSRESGIIMFMTNLVLEAYEREELERMVRSQRISNALAQRRARRLGTGRWGNVSAGH